MAFNLKQMISKNQLKPEYICTQFMFEVDESTMINIDPFYSYIGSLSEGQREDILAMQKELDVAEEEKELKIEKAQRMLKELETTAKKRKEEGLGPTDEEKKRMAGQLKGGYRPEGE